MSDGGKGSAPRPFSVSQKEYADNYDRIFRKTPKEIEDALAEDEAFKIIEEIMKERTKINLPNK
jgi:hypothetical protein